MTIYIEYQDWQCIGQQNKELIMQKLKRHLNRGINAWGQGKKVNKKHTIRNQICERDKVKYSWGWFVAH